jgi:apolipoprotein N-acyltransferase
LGIATLSGLITGLGFPPLHLWVLIPVGVAGMAWACCHLKPGRGLLAGWLYGFGFNIVVVHWISVLGVPVLAILVAWMAVWYGLVGLVLSLTRKIPGGLLVGMAMWIAIEWGAARWPMGGFGWARLAFSAAGTPIDGLFPLISSTGVSLLIAGSGFGLAWIVRTLERHASTQAASLLRSRVLPRVGVLGAYLIFVGAGGILGNTWTPVAEGETYNVAVVQGNVPGSGIDALGPTYTVENNHLAQTILLAAAIRTGAETQPDFVIWPENSTATDPLTDKHTQKAITTAVDLMGVPILVGAITRGPGEDERQTTALWWTVDDGIEATYHKRNLVPFGEWIPARDLLLPLIDVLKYIGAQSVPGTTPGVLNVTTNKGQLRLGDIICFELAYDDTFNEMMTGDETTGGGAQIVAVQTSNAMFTGTDQMSQQDAITRVRAMEARRDILVATTNSLAGLIDARGSVVYEAELRTSDSHVFSVTTSTHLTPAVRFRTVFDIAGVGFPLLLWAVVLMGSTRANKRVVSQGTEEGVA